MAADGTRATPILPGPRGPLSAAVIDALRSPPTAEPPLPAGPADADAYGDDLQLTLQICYELHYRGFAGVDPDWEWDPRLLRTRALLEAVFLAAVRGDTDPAGAGVDDVWAAVDELLVEPEHGEGPAHHLRERGTWPQLREFLVHRSIYHLKEADPHAWVIPRLRGRAKAALVAVEYDEFGAGRAENVHSRLYADLLTGAGLSADYLGYLDAVPAPALAVVNLMSLFGLHRRWRGALVGHFAAAEITTAPSARRMADALHRLDADPACVRFYTEHVVADAVHEQVMRHEVLGDLLDHEPELAADVVLGIRATELLEDALGRHLMSAWRAGRSSLRPGTALAVAGVAERVGAAAPARADRHHEAVGDH